MIVEFLSLAILSSILYFIVRNIEDARFYYENYRDGTLTFTMMYDYALLHVRHISSYYLEVGYIEIQNNNFYLVYYSGSQKYRLVFPKSKRKISYVTTEEGEDISESFFEYLGPGNNFYSISTTPKMISINYPIIVGYKKGVNIEEKRYEPTDIILTEI